MLLVHRFFARAAATPDAEAFVVYARGGTQAPMRLTWGRWRNRARALAAALLRQGVQPGDRVAILAGNRPMWPVADVAVQSLGAIGVGVYPASAPSQVDALLVDSGARWLLTDDVAQATRLAHAPVGALSGAVIDVAEDAAGALQAARGQRISLQTLDSFESDGAQALTADAAIGAALAARLEAIRPDDLAALIYTSGSTGVPKGACVSHAYLAASAASIAEVLALSPDDRGISFLPYSHAAERVFGQCTRIHVGMAAALVEDPSDLFAVCAHYEPTLLGALPRIFERLYEAAEIATRSGGSARDAIVARVGGRLRLATSGGAALPLAVAARLDELGVRILGAYGQTEHLCVAMNRPEAPRFDTVGLPMPGSSVRIAADGELLVARSALTFSGYWQRPDETRAAFTDDGVWLRTGDLAAQDADGALRITGRVKELIALSTGRKVAPLPIEAALVATPFVSHAVLHGEGEKYVVALLSLRRAVVEQWAARQAIDTPWPSLAQHPEVRAQLSQAVAQVNTELARTDRVQAFAITPDEFTVETGLLTGTLKVVRAEVERRYAREFASLYPSNGARS